MTEKRYGINLEFTLSNEELKDKEEQKVLKDTKKEIHDEFYYLKETTKEFNKLVSFINGINMPEEVKSNLLLMLNDNFNKTSSSEIKYKSLKKINKLINYVQENIGKLDLLEIKEYMENQILLDFKSDKYKNIEIYRNISGLILLSFIPISFILISAGIFESWIPVSILCIGISGLVYTNNFLEDLENNNKKIHNIYNIVSKIFPQINREEFEKIKELYLDGKFDIIKFLDMMKEYQEDGKITEEERKKIEQFLGMKSSH